MKPKLILALVIFILLSSGWVVPPNRSVQPTRYYVYGVIVINEAKEAFTLDLTGPKTYKHNVAARPRKQVFYVDFGVYQYRYKTCGKYQTGQIEVKSRNPGYLRIPPCQVAANSGEPVSATIVNGTDGLLVLKLTGLATYNFTLQPGRHTVKLVAGRYRYTATYCGKTKSSKIQVNKDQAVFFSCRK